MGSEVHVLLALLSFAAAEDAPADRYILGSYGRAQASSDLSGGRGESVNVVAYGPRLEASPYAEIDLGFQHVADGATRFSALITPAIAGDLFHYDGQWDADLAVRNLYAMAELDRGPGTLTAWAGSRMYRGDDVYLLNFWPLDMLNTLGGGLGYGDERFEVAAHVGFNRVLGQDFQLQTWARPEPGGVGEQDVVVLDRQRRIASLKGHYQLPVGERLTLRAKAYGELHHLAEGTRLVDDEFEQALPEDIGAAVGLQLSAWGWAPHSYAHLFYKRSSGLAAYGELSIPSSGLAPDYTVATAREEMFALALNQEIAERVSWSAGAYVRGFTDADGQELDVDDRWELALATRPIVNIGQYVGLGIEASHQWLRPNGLNPRTEQHDVPQVTKLSLLPMLKPAPNTFARPMIHLTYTVSLLNEDALAWYDPLDQRASSQVQHFVGLGAEWWMNSQSYR